MEGDADAYEQLLARISDLLPHVATQIREEVARGIPRSEPTPVEQEWMPDWTFETVPGKFEAFKRGADVGVRDYSAAERLTILVEALRTVSATMLESRQVLSHLFDSPNDETRNGQIRVTFVDPASSASTASLGVADLAETQALARATRSLAEVLDAVRPRG